jgi:hypothetical protein
MKTAPLLRAVFAWAVVTAVSAAFGQNYPQKQILPRFTMDGLILSISEGSGTPVPGRTPLDLYAAAGVTFEAWPTFAAGELLGFARFNAGTSFGRAFRVIQNFDFGAGAPWALRYVQPNHVFCGIPEGCPGVFETQRVFNFSARAEVQTGDGATIGGMIIPGEFPRLVVFKVRGPSLAKLGVTAPLANPHMLLYQDGEVIFENDDWGTLRLWEQELADSVCPPPGDEHESMLVTYLDPGAYTAVVRGVDGGTGVALLEMYLVDAFRVE